MKVSEGSVCGRVGRRPFTAARSSAAGLCSLGIMISSLLMLASCTAPASPPVATVSVNTQQFGAQIPKDFLGFSNEVSTAGMGLPTPTEQARGNIQPPSDVPPR